MQKQRKGRRKRDKPAGTQSLLLFLPLRLLQRTPTNSIFFFFLFLSLKRRLQWKTSIIYYLAKACKSMSAASPNFERQQLLFLFNYLLFLFNILFNKFFIVLFISFKYYIFIIFLIFFFLFYYKSIVKIL